MTTPASPSTSDSATPAPGPSSEQQFATFWQKNSTAIYAFCAIIVVGIVAKGGWNYLQAGKEQSVEADYAAATTPEALKTFVSSHEGHPLAGAAELQIADRAYVAEKYADAATAYESSLKDLPAGPFAYRAKLGLAMSQFQGGKTSDGEAGLKTLSADTSAPGAIRAEATYQLASIAAAAGRTAEAIKLAESVATMDQTGWWAQRAYGLRSTLGPVAPSPGAIKLK